MYQNKLRELRESQNQAVIAKLLGVGVKAYSMYETETEIIPISHLVTLADYFNVSIDYLFEFSDKRYKSIKKETDSLLSGIRLKEFRKEHNLTQSKLGEVLKCSYGTIAGYESGRYPIATPFLYDICKKYNISADYLLGKTDSPKYLK